MKPKKKYIREELIKEIKDDIEKVQKELFKHWDALKLAYLGDFKTKITDYKGRDWFVSIKIPCPSTRLYGDYNQYLFIDKATGKNRHPKKVK